MASANGEEGSGTPRPVSALPSVQARILAFGAIVIAGVSGGLIGFSAVKVGCQGGGPSVAGVPRVTTKNCSTPAGVGGVAGAVIAAGGVAVISVLVLRAMGEWRSIKEKRQLEAMIAAAGGAGGAGGAAGFEVEVPTGEAPADTPVIPAVPSPVTDAAPAGEARSEDDTSTLSQPGDTSEIAAVDPAPQVETVPEHETAPAPTDNPPLAGTDAPTPATSPPPPFTATPEDAG